MILYKLILPAWIAVSFTLVTSATVDVMKGLELFRKREMKDSIPLLLQHTSEVDPNDYVALEHIAAFYSMSARRLANKGGDQSVNAAEKRALRSAVHFFQRATKSFDAKRSSTEVYPQEKYGHPRELVLRAYGDALNWLGETEKAKRMLYHRGVVIEQLWAKSYLCRSAPEYPTVQTHHKKFQEFMFFPADEVVPFFDYVVAPIRELLPLLKPLVEADIRAHAELSGLETRAEDALGLTRGKWRPESGGLSTDNKSWFAHSFAVNGKIVPQKQRSGRFKEIYHRIGELLRANPAYLVKEGQIKLSLMFSGTRVKPHCGPTNARLRMHCTVILPEESSPLHINVGTERRQWKENECFVFDETCQHEVIIPPSNMASMPRVVLIVDFANPMLLTETLYRMNGLDLLQQEVGNSEDRQKLEKAASEQYQTFQKSYGNLLLEKNREEL
jgi:aspartate beta-hydroxylase